MRYILINQSASNIVFFILLFFCFFPVIVFGQNNGNSYEVSKELKISTPNGCDYYEESFVSSLFSFEYPKLFFMEKNIPIIAFVDKNSDKLIFLKIIDQHYKVLSKIDSFRKETYHPDRWPIILNHENEINLAVLRQDHPKKASSSYTPRIYELNINDNRYKLIREIDVSKNEDTKQLFKERGSFSDIYPYSQDAKKYMIFGTFKDIHFHPLAILSGDFPSFSKNFSMIWDGNKIGQFQTIEKKGWFWVKDMVYAVTDTGVAHATWVRDDGYTGKFSRKDNNTLYYSRNVDGGGWSAPLEIYSVKDTVIDSTKNIFIAANNRNAYLFWEVWDGPEKGGYFANIKNGNNAEVIKIIESEYLKKWRGGGKLYRAISSKIATDQQGNVFVLWIGNSGTLSGEVSRSYESYEMLLISRIAGKWMPPMVVNSGIGNVHLPDMAIDKRGEIHLTYVKSDQHKDISCYYQNLMPISEYK